MVWLKLEDEVDVGTLTRIEIHFACGRGLNLSVPRVRWLVGEAILSVNRVHTHPLAAASGLDADLRGERPLGGADLCASHRDRDVRRRIHLLEQVAFVVTNAQGKPVSVIHHDGDRGAGPATIEVVQSILAPRGIVSVPLGVHFEGHEVFGILVDQ